MNFLRLVAAGRASLPFRKMTHISNVRQPVAVCSSHVHSGRTYTQLSQPSSLSSFNRERQLSILFLALSIFCTYTLYSHIEKKKELLKVAKEALDL